MTAPLLRKIPALIVILVSTLAGCATSLKTPAGHRVEDNIYNKEIERQGLLHYCAENRCDTPPKLISALAPVYPREALANRESGKTAIFFDINDDGSTGNFEVESSTSPEFSESAVQAVKEWRFTPATLGGKPIKLRVRQIIPFVPSK